MLDKPPKIVLTFFAAFFRRTNTASSDDDLGWVYRKYKGHFPRKPSTIFRVQTPVITRIATVPTRVSGKIRTERIAFASEFTRQIDPDRLRFPDCLPNEFPKRDRPGSDASTTYPCVHDTAERTVSAWSARTACVHSAAGRLFACCQRRSTGGDQLRGKIHLPSRSRACCNASPANGRAPDRAVRNMSMDLRHERRSI